MSKLPPIKDYTTQYNQSDLDFVNMLCEQEGYALILKDDDNSNYKIIVCELNDCVIINNEPIECTYNRNVKFKVSKYVEDYYDKNNPSQNYKIEKVNTIPNKQDNPISKQLRNDIVKEKFRDKLNSLNESFYEDLNRYSNVDSNKEYSQSNVIEVTSNDLMVKDSMNATLLNDKENKKIDVIILEVKCKASFPNALDEYVEKIESNNMQFIVEFKAIPKDIVYKPKITVEKPRIYGIQTAIVTGQDVNNSPITPNQNTIDVDEFGRVRVLFHFERNKTTSCYLRVSNISSGNNYGSQFVPRVNSEVIVSFLNGNPDCPIIIGTLYNGENKIPYPLPQNKTKSYIRTYSTPQYEDKIGYNEILFEDKKGSEEFNFHAQKDMNSLILNNETKKVKHNQTTLIENDKQEDVNNKSKLNVKNNYEINVKKDFVQTVEEEKIVTVNKDYDVFANKDFNVIVKENVKQIIEKDFTQRVKGNKITYVEQDVKQKYLQNLFKQINKDFRLDVKDNLHIKANKIKIEADVLEISSNKEVNIKGGSNNLSLNQNGLFMNAPMVNPNSSYLGAFANDVEALVELYDQQIRLVDSTSGKPFINQKYKITASTGEVLEGITDNNGFTQRIKTQDEATLNIEIINEGK